ncbi:glutamate-cysteine ligase modifier subunit [Diaporthe amygdali]|uniref:glutamate-cysteine ligase modifier subunit n=1 Tax=Phomopsis amygdali TaxID=1214568 RepID=UPI0022FEDC3D|nr:glutamate-cysteine ligase modifier subunit [Diaporthe amygdali]KAJ0119105.1 glutamate-cysteine ligase modifier subunit [Diaporthe amygdali]
MPLALKTQSFFERLKKFVLALIDRILPKKHKLSLSRGQRSTMAKQLVLSTGNIVSGGPSIIRKPGAYRSNLELTNSLRSNFLAAKQEYASATPTSNGHANGSANGTAATTPNGIADATDAQPATPTTKTPTPLPTWTSRDPADDNTLYIPRIDWSSDTGLQEDPSQYDITVKIFYLPTSDVASRAAYTRRALALVLKELGVSSVSLLIASFPGMSFEGDCEWEADKLNASQGDDGSELATWARAVEPLHDEGLARQLGIAEFGSEKLARFLAAARVRPSVDQINIKNCCNVPPPLVTLARDAGIELFVHSDCTDILPKGTLRELLGQGVRGAGVLADPAEGVDDGLRGELTPQWVVKYTAVVRDRGVIENKGYFAGAELIEDALSGALAHGVVEGIDIPHTHLVLVESQLAEHFR